MSLLPRCIHHDNSQVLQLFSKTLLSSACSTQKMLDSQEGAPDVDLVCLLPDIQWHIPDGAIIAFVCDAGVDN